MPNRNKPSFIKYMYMFVIFVCTSLLTYTILDGIESIYTSVHMNNKRIIEIEKSINELYELQCELSERIRQLDIEMDNQYIITFVEATDTFIPLDIELDRDIQEYIFARAKEYGHDPLILIALIQKESGFNPNAISKTRDRGLAQMSEKYHDYVERLFGREFDPFNPYDSIDYLVLRLDYDREHWQNNGQTGSNLLKCMLGSYNKGRSGYTSFLNENGYDYKYITDVLSNYQNLIAINKNDI